MFLFTNNFSVSVRLCKAPRMVEDGQGQPWFSGTVLFVSGISHQHKRHLHYQCTKSKEGLLLLFEFKQMMPTNIFKYLNEYLLTLCWILD